MRSHDFCFKSKKLSKRLSTWVTRESVARGDVFFCLSRQGYHQPDVFSERWLGGAFPADGLGYVHQGTHDWWLTWGQIQESVKLFRNRRGRKIVGNECRQTRYWEEHRQNQKGERMNVDGQRRNPKPFQPLVSFLAKCVSLFLEMTFPHIQRDHARSAVLFFPPTYYSLVFSDSSSNNTWDRENSLHPSCVRILPLNANCFTGI